MRAFRLRLENALGSGAALALLAFPACGGSSATDGAAAGASGASAGASSASAGASGEVAGAAGVIGIEDAGAGSSALEPYPADALVCIGPEHDGGLFGRCCANALCYTPDTGSDCVAAKAAPAKLNEFYGSGQCLCGDIQGPYASNPTHAPSKAGTCCYVVSSIACEGRPLLVDDVAVVSELARRCDWITADLLELLS